MVDIYDPDSYPMTVRVAPQSDLRKKIRLTVHKLEDIIALQKQRFEVSY